MPRGGNPHAPTTTWLEAVACPGDAYDADAEEGDKGTTTVTRDGKRFEVTVECVSTDAAVAVCEECDAELGTSQEIGERLYCPECDTDDAMVVEHRKK